MVWLAIIGNGLTLAVGGYVIFQQISRLNTKDDLFWVRRGMLLGTILLIATAIFSFWFHTCHYWGKCTMDSVLFTVVNDMNIVMRVIAMAMLGVLYFTDRGTE